MNQSKTNESSDSKVIIVVSNPGQLAEMNSLCLSIKDYFQVVLYFNLGSWGKSKNELMKNLSSEAELLFWDQKSESIKDIHNKTKFQGAKSNNFSDKSIISKTVTIIESILAPVNRFKTKNLSKAFYFLKGVLIKIIYELSRLTPQTYRRVEEKIANIYINTWSNKSIVERNMLKSLAPKAILLPEDAIDYLTPLLISEANQQDISSYILPYTLANIREYGEAAIDDNRFTKKSRFLNEISMKHPKWSTLYKGKEILKSRPSLILTAERLNLAPPNPWIMNSGFSTKILADSNAMADYLTAGGIAKEKIEITGFPANDFIFANKAKKSRLVAELVENDRITQNKDIALIAFPADQAPLPPTEFTNFEYFTEFFLTELFEILESKYNILFSFHPREDKDKVDYLCEKYNLLKIDGPTAEVIPISDLYIASISATIRWAIASGIPTLNYDIYSYNYDDFKGVKSVLEVSKKEEFKNALRKIAFDSEFMDSLKAESIQTGKYWGRSDGNATKRIIDIINNTPSRAENPKSISSFHTN